LNDVIGSNGASVGHVGGGTIVSVMNEEEPEEGRETEERDEDPNKQLEMENRRRSSAITLNGRESLQDVEMS
jgi:hypothetical protein